MMRECKQCGLTKLCCTCVDSIDEELKMCFTCDKERALSSYTQLEPNKCRKCRLWTETRLSPEYGFRRVTVRPDPVVSIEDHIKLQEYYWSTKGKTNKALQMKIFQLILEREDNE